MAASGGWIEIVLELVFRGILGFLRGWDEWWPYGCMLAAAGIATVIMLLILHQVRKKRDSRES
jgi:hypothetical protein